MFLRYICSVKLVKSISAILIGTIFLISSSGFLIYKSHCSCTGNEQVSIFVENEICETEESDSCCEIALVSCCSDNETNLCESHSNDCDCNNSEVTYVKLTDKVVKGEVRFLKVEPIQLIIPFATLQLNLPEAVELTETGITYLDQPSLFESSIDFLIRLNQLKIPIA